MAIALYALASAFLACPGIHMHAQDSAASSDDMVLARSGFGGRSRCALAPTRHVRAAVGDATTAGALVKFITSPLLCSVIGMLIMASRKAAISAAVATMLAVRSSVAWSSVLVSCRARSLARRVAYMLAYLSVVPEPELTS